MERWGDGEMGGKGNTGILCAGSTTDNGLRTTDSHTTASAKETFTLGQELAAELNAGDVLALYGQLGAGKTVLVKGICAGLGITEPVTSPTFVLVQTYAGGRLPVTHIDAYRLEGEGAGEEFAEYFTPGGIVLIEWAERLASFLPTRRLEIHLERVSNHRRHITLIDRRGPDHVRKS